MEKFYIDSEWLRDLYTGIGEDGDPYVKEILGIIFMVSRDGITAHWYTENRTCYHHKLFKYTDLGFDPFYFYADGKDILQELADLINDYFKDYEGDEQNLPF